MGFAVFLQDKVDWDALVTAEQTTSINFSFSIIHTSLKNVITVNCMVLGPVS